MTLAPKVPVPDAPAAPTVPSVRLEDIGKSFGNTAAVNNISLDIQQGEFFSLLGPSGCGKTTLLRMLAGFESPDRGRILIDGQDMTRVPPYARPINMMFQSYALFPHMSVADNIAFGLRQTSMARTDRNARVQEMMELVQISPLARRKPHQLSGGQRQRVALARALARHPSILLLDEPLGALDKKLREKTQFELMNIQQRLGTTFIVVTHDQEEAMTMSSRIALMREGQIEQLDAPRRLYEFPATRYAASFIGSINLFDARVLRQNGDEVTLACDAAGAELQVRSSEKMLPGMALTLAVRPEKIRLLHAGDAATAGQPANRLRGRIKEIAYLGGVSIYHAELPSGKRVQFTQPNVQALAEQPLSWEQDVMLGWQPDSCSVLTE
ncbi:ABC transporter ATP-binding protein [Marinobacterium rhizophilum]|uniref:Spermidine/putrescine import ATP-binding protein PotA n=1 Tax=Marinobacterium rhizophilum TaxID=420402 RepID=A0ABY5HRP2_9GAMM|nr:ABC transporter ATP-binding protein [Marinobacterium rhizophilum]UTW13892.1 ABC transporter ATP-binding protein [Marinobacterium rhizophilum]